MARGDGAKETVRNKIFEVFDGAFIASDGKTIRVPIVDGAETIEVKISLVAAKDLEGGGASPATAGATDSAFTFSGAASVTVTEPTPIEIDNVNRLAAMLGF